MSYWFPLDVPMTDIRELPPVWLASYQPHNGKILITGRRVDGEVETVTVAISVEFAVDTANTDIRKGVGMLLADVFARISNPHLDQCTAAYDLEGWRQDHP